MVLFIFESIGTSELILIGIIALMFLGPRKLPQIARNIGKTMADFRSTTNEFKSTWEKEVNFEEEEKLFRSGDLQEEPAQSMPVGETEPIAVPAIKAMDKESFDNIVRKSEKIPDETEAMTEKPETDEVSDKRNWL